MDLMTPIGTQVALCRVRELRQATAAALQACSDKEAIKLARMLEQLSALSEDLRTWLAEWRGN